jgi:hypothetical protein
MLLSFFILHSIFNFLCISFSILMLTHERIPGNDHITSCTLWYVSSVANQLRLSCFYLPSLVWDIRLPHSSVSFRISLPLIPTVTFGILIVLFLSLMRGLGRCRLVDD